MNEFEPYTGPEDRRQARRNLIIKVAATVGVAAAIGSVFKNEVQVSYNPHNQAATLESTCKAEATQKDFAAVEKLFNGQPKNSVNPSDYGLHRYTDLQGMAELSGYTKNSKPRPPFSEYLSTANGVLSHYGVKIYVPKPGYKALYPSDGRAPKPAELATASTQNGILRTMEGFYFLPVEYVHLLGVKKIILMARSSWRAQAELGGDHDTIRLNITAGLEPEDVAHEEYHFLDKRECGLYGMRQDPAYSSLNPRQIYGNFNELTYLQYLAERKERVVKRFSKGRGLTYCRLSPQDDKQAKRVVVWSAIGLGDEAEDKAELGSQIAFPFAYHELRNKRSPVLRAKFNLLMSRLHHIAPNVARYLIDQSLTYKQKTNEQDC